VRLNGPLWILQLGFLALDRISFLAVLAHEFDVFAILVPFESVHCFPNFKSMSKLEMDQNLFSMA